MYNYVLWYGLKISKSFNPEKPPLLYTSKHICIYIHIRVYTYSYIHVHIWIWRARTHMDIYMYVYTHLFVWCLYKFTSHTISTIYPTPYKSLTHPSFRMSQYKQIGKKFVGDFTCNTKLIVPTFSLPFIVTLLNTLLKPFSTLYSFISMF